MSFIFVLFFLYLNWYFFINQIVCDGAASLRYKKKIIFKFENVVCLKGAKSIIHNYSKHMWHHVFCSILFSIMYQKQIKLFEKCAILGMNYTHCLCTISWLWIKSITTTKFGFKKSRYKTPSTGKNQNHFSH